jgi:hypothetical protein
VTLEQNDEKLADFSMAYMIAFDDSSYSSELLK